MEIQAFGYLGVGGSNLDDWAAFATSNVGMQAVDRTSSMRAFRMDDRKQRLFIDRATGRAGLRLGSRQCCGSRSDRYRDDQLQSSTT